MKVLLLNGSPHPNGCTFRALSEVEKTLQQEGIETEIFHIGTEAIRGCMGAVVCAVRTSLEDVSLVKMLLT